MPSYRTPGVAGEFGFLKKCGGNGGIAIKITHIPTGRSCRFLGALKGFKDNYTSTWKEEPVYGRMDPIPTFQRTGRKISISWTIVNESVKIGKENMTEVSKLINFLYPKYSSQEGGATTISTAPVLKLQFTNLVNSSGGGGLVGFLAGFTFDPVIDAGWVKTSGSELIPKELEANCEFTVLHTDSLGWTATNNPRTKGFPYGRNLKVNPTPAVLKPTDEAIRENLKASGMSDEEMLDPLEFGDRVRDAINRANEEGETFPGGPEKPATDAARRIVTGKGEDRQKIK
jgi:hypothetical protein